VRFELTEKEIDSVANPMTDIRIVGLNTDKTRRMIGSETVYQVYFELTGIPPQGWTVLFEQNWKALNAGKPLTLQEASVNRAFLVIRCALQEVANNLPVLAKAVAAANIAYEKYAREQVAEQKNREDVWKDERKIVEDVAKSLHFD
jgi:hypothetical protein